MDVTVLETFIALKWVCVKLCLLRLFAFVLCEQLSKSERRVMIIDGDGWVQK